MNKFRDTIKKEGLGLIALAIAMLVLLAAFLYPSRGVMIDFGDFEESAPLFHVANFVAGFATGFYLAVFFSVLVRAVRCAYMLRNESALSKCYVARSDERNRAIAEKVGGMTTMTMLVLLSAGAFSTFALGLYEASLALIAALCALVLIRAVLCVVYKRKL